MAVVGAAVMIIVADSLARAFAIAGAAGLVRYRAQIDDPKEAGVLLVSLAVGLASGSGLFAVAVALCVFVILVLWILESVEPPDRAQFDLVIASRESLKIRPQIEHAFRGKGVQYQLWGSSPNELRYEVSVPFDQDIKKGGRYPVTRIFDLSRRGRTVNRRSSAAERGRPVAAGGSHEGGYRLPRRAGQRSEEQGRGR